MKKIILEKVMNLKRNMATARAMYLSFKEFMFGKNLETSKYILEHSEDLKKQVWKPIKFSLLTVAFAFFFFVVWGGLAPLDSAAIAPGHIVLSEKNKVIQHLEGGVIEKIFVKEGTLVEDGQPLIKLNDTSAKAKLQMVLSQLRTVKATEIRLLAEKLNEPEVLFTDPIFDTAIPEVQKLIATQTALFDAKTKSINGKLDILNKKIIQYKEQIKGLESAVSSTEAQTTIAKEQLSTSEHLYNQGFAKRSDFLEMKRRYHELFGRLGQIKAELSSANETIAETQLQIINTQNENQKEINSELKESQAQIQDLQEQYQAVLDVLERTTIKSPTEGVVTGMQYSTVGGVINPGTKIMEIIPQKDTLVIEAKVQPKDIESVGIGMDAKVQLSAYKTRLVPRIDGRVIYVSADKTDDERMGPYYVVRVEVSKTDIDRINYEVKLYPGMPAEVFIVKGERTFLQYMLSPIVDSFHKAFKEK